MSRKIKHHSKKALRSLLGNIILEHLRVPRVDNHNNVIRYKKDVRTNILNKNTGKQITHHKGDIRLRKLKGKEDFKTWFRVGNFHIEPKDSFKRILLHDTNHSNGLNSNNNMNKNPGSDDSNNVTKSFGPSSTSVNFDSSANNNVNNTFESNTNNNMNQRHSENY